jgi:hypothetical protein
MLLRLCGLSMGGLKRRLEATMRGAKLPSLIDHSLCVRHPARSLRMAPEITVSFSLCSGPSRGWIKVKNPNSPAMIRAGEAEW